MDNSQSQSNPTAQYRVVIAPIAATAPAGANCADCSASCQSACKTSCTVGNQPCTAVVTDPA